MSTPTKIVLATVVAAAVIGGAMVGNLILI